MHDNNQHGNPETPQKLSEHGDHRSTSRSSTGITTDSGATHFRQEMLSVSEMNRIGPFADRYQIIEEIARGGMGVVYKAKQLGLNKICAIKMLRVVAINDETIRRFNREARAVSKLNHPNLITAFDFGVLDSGEPYMVMEFVEGQSLSTLVEKLGCVPEKDAAEIFIQIARGMEYAHDQGVIHRDLKPSNIMLLRKQTSATSSPLVRIIDFGIARLSNPELGHTSDLTKTGDIFGSPLYMSPEQAHGYVVDRRSDVYSVGVLMFEALSGSPPFAGMSALDTILKHLNDDVPKLRTKNGKPIHPVLEQIVYKALQKDPDNRYQSMLEMQEELERANNMITSPVASVLSKVAAKPKASSSRLIGLWYLAAAALVGALIILCTIFWPGSKSNQSVHKYMTTKLPDETAKDELIQNSEKVLPSNDLWNRSKISMEQGETFADYSKSGLTDDQMKDLAHRPELQKAILSNNPIKGPGLKYLSNLQLKELILAHTEIDDQAMPYITKIKSLEWLSLNNTAITDDALARLHLLPHLNQLHVDHCNITDRGIDYIVKQAPKLEYLSLSYNSSLSDRALAKLAQLKYLKMLILNGDRVSDDTAILLANSLKLNRFELGDTGITDKTLAAFSGKDFTFLSLYHTRITDAGVLKLANCELLHTVQVRRCPRVSRAGKDALIAKLPDLDISR
ncbi:MAG TPA: protein kinase [Chroococcales cyanobacterium]